VKRQHFVHLRAGAAVHSPRFIHSFRFIPVGLGCPDATIIAMNVDLERMLNHQGGVATSSQILDCVTRYAFDCMLDDGTLERLWQGIYCRDEATDDLRLRGLDLSCGTTVAVCLSTAAARYDFDTEDDAALHVINPPRRQLRSADGLVVHRREGAPLNIVDGRPVTAPAWTAVEVARGLRRPRALATLDAALRSGTCSRTELWRAVLGQAGRRGVVAVRNLIALADPAAESPMESELRLIILDADLPTPALQYEVLDGNGELRRLDLAWPEHRVAVEYDGVPWHSGADALRRDRVRHVALQDIGWVAIPAMFDDVRHRPADLVARINHQLRRAQAA
jgi:hypothetical protein